MRRILTLLLGVAGLMSALVAQDTDEIANLSARGARIDRAADGALLTLPSNAARSEIVSSFLRGRHDAATIGSLVVDGENATRQGPVHVRLQPVHHDAPVACRHEPVLSEQRAPRQTLSARLRRGGRQLPDQ